MPSQCRLSSRTDQLTIWPMPFILLWRGKFSSMAKLANSDMPSVKAPNMAKVRATSRDRADAEGVHVVGLGAHLVIIAERLELGLGHAQVFSSSA